MGGPGASVYVAVFTYLAIVVVLFATQAPRRAVLVSLLGGLLFLPMFDRRASFGIIHTKLVLVETSVFLASVLFHWDRWRRLRLRGWDVPVVLTCLTPFVASISNALGAYDGASAIFEAWGTWGAAYALGRVHFRDGRAFRDLARGLVAGALVYAPFCWWEVRMSPQLHRLVYGFHQHSFLQHVRGAGYRPMVFMQHGLMVATFMATGALLAYWLWRSRDRLPLFGIPLGWGVVLLGLTTVLCKSTGALVLLGAGILALEAGRGLRTSAFVLALLALPPAYCVSRLNGWSAERVVEVAYRVAPPERASSLEFRIRNENMLIGKAMMRPWFGWGRWGGSRVYEEGRDLATTDGLWILALGTGGVVGLSLLWGALLLPVTALLRAFSRRLWRDPRLAPAGALAVSLAAWVVDEVANGMITPVYPLVAGALVSLAVAGRRASLRPATFPAPPRALSLDGCRP